MKIIKAFKWYFRIKRKLNKRIENGYFERFGGWCRSDNSRERLLKRLDGIIELEERVNRQSDELSGLYRERSNNWAMLTSLEAKNAKLKARINELKYTRYL